MKPIFAFILMGAQYDPEKDQAHFETESKPTYIYTVQNWEQAKKRVQDLYQKGCGAIEVCGAFGPEKTKELISLTEGKVAIGYVTHFAEQDALFTTFFGK